MTDEELERMRAYADAAAKPWPSYQEAYAQDVPKLLNRVDNYRALIMRIAQAVRGEADGLEYGDLQELPKDITASNRIWSEAQLRLESEIRELAEKNERLRLALDQVANDGGLEPIERRQIATHALAGVVYAEPVEHDRLWHRLRFAEMVLDRVGAEVDGVPWREAARLSESLDGEPVTEPVAPASNPGVSS